MLGPQSLILYKSKYLDLFSFVLRNSLLEFLQTYEIYSLKFFNDKKGIMLVLNLWYNLFFKGFRRKMFSTLRWALTHDKPKLIRN